MGSFTLPARPRLSGGRWILAPNSSPIDPERIRLRVLDALRVQPDHAHLEALKAATRGEIDIDDRPFDDEIVVQIGDVTVVITRSSVLGGQG